MSTGAGESWAGPREVALGELEEVDSVGGWARVRAAMARVRMGSGRPSGVPSFSGGPSIVGEVLAGMVVTTSTSCLWAPAPQSWVSSA